MSGGLAKARQVRGPARLNFETEHYANLEVSTEKLPDVDTPEASHVCSLR